MSTANARDRLPGLDLLRALAIVWVMLFHSFLVGGLGPDWAWLSRFGWMGVDLFFVLSGFLIGSQLLAPLARGERLRFGAFYLRRAFRILPAFGVVLALYLAWPAFREAPGMEPWWKFASFTVNLSIDYGRNQAFSHAWSLCVEEHFYLLFPLVAWALARRTNAVGFGALCAFVVLGGIVLRSLLWSHFDALDPDRNWFIEDIYYPTWCRLDGLLAGVALAAIRTFRPQAWARLGAHANALASCGLVIVGAAIWLFRDRVGLPGNAIGWPVLACGLALLVCAGAQTRGVLGRWRVPGAAWLAATSYSLYLVHKAVFHLVDSAWGPALEGRGVLAFAAYGAAALLAGAVLHYGVERPLLALRDRLDRRRTRAAAPATATA